MSRYVDADALSEYVEKQYMGFIGNPTWDDINSAPSIDIVRCKECKHGEYRKDFDDYICDQLGLGFVADADFFCGYGEREGE